LIRERRVAKGAERAMSTRSSLGKIPYATKEPKWVRRKGARHRMSRANRGLRFADPPYGL